MVTHLHMLNRKCSAWSTQKHVKKNLQMCDAKIISEFKESPVMWTLEKVFAFLLTPLPP